MGPSFRPKTEQELGRQLSAAENAIGVPLRPPHSDLNFLRTILKELKERYPKRYQFYHEELRREKRGDVLGEDEARRMKAWLQAMNSLDTYIHDHHQDVEGSTLTEHQITVFEAIHSFFEKGGSKGYIKLPTGSGKTVIFIEMIEAMDLKALVVLPRKILLEQTVERMEEFADDLDVGRVYSAAKEHGRKVTLITYDSFVSGVKAGLIDPKEFDLLVLDEVHRGLSDKRKEALGKFSHALQVGFTATPVFSDKKKVEQILPGCIFEMSIREAVEKRMLCSFISGVIQTNVDLSKVTIKDTGEYDAEELEAAVDIESRNRAAVNAYKEVAPSGKAVVYCAGISHSKHVAERFVKDGIAAAAVWGAMPKNDLKTTLADFASGKIKVLCNSDLLIEGFDDKEVGLCINLRPTRSFVVSEQRGGRVLRNNPKNPEKVAVIVDFLDRHGKTGLAGSVLFAEIAGGSMIEQPVQKKRKKRDDEKKDEKKDDTEMMAAISQDLLAKLKKINLEDVQITFEVEEIVRIIQERNIVVPSIEKFLKYDDFICETKAAGVTSKNYEEKRATHPDWPSNPHRFYKGYWKGWKDITGKVANRDKQFLSYSEFLIQAQSEGVTKHNYQKKRKSHSDWPSMPHVVYANDWKSWSELSQIENKTFVSYNDFIREAKATGVTSKNYQEIRTKYPNWPSSPASAYKEWSGWGEITGNADLSKKEFLSFKEFVEQVRALGVTSLNYREMRKKHLDWPSNPEITYKVHWNGWREITKVK